MTPTNENIQSMAAILAAMNNATGDVPSDSASLSESISTPKGKVDSSLKNIMDSFRAATDGAVEQIAGNRTLELAYDTVRDEAGVRVGAWRIDVREESGMGKFYNVTHSMTGDPIINDLRLYEAALALVNGLNDGQTINSARSKMILEFENDYARALSDAVSFKSTAAITEGARHDIAEARYSEARRKAIVAKKAIAKLTDL